MGKNYAQRIVAEQDRLFNAGMDTGEQLAADSFANAMYKCGISKNKIVEVTQLAMQISSKYSGMIDTKRNVEADVLQEHFDAPLREIFGGGYVPWEERYDKIRKCKY